MTKPVPCPPAPGPLEEYAARFDDLFTRVAQRRGFREYLAGLLAPRDRNKTLTALAGAEPVTGARGLSNNGTASGDNGLRTAGVSVRLGLHQSSSQADSGSSSAGNPDSCSRWASDRNRTGIRRLYDRRYGAARPTIALVSSPLMLLPDDVVSVVNAGQVH